MSVKIALSFLDESVYLFQVFQIPYRSRKEKSERKVCCIRESFSTTLLVTDEIHHHSGFLIADGDDNIFLYDYTKRYSCVRCSWTDGLEMRYTQNYHQPSVIIVITCSLISIANVCDEVVGHVKFVDEEVDVVFYRAGDLHPAWLLPSRNGFDAIFCIPKCAHCSVTLLEMNKRRIGQR